MSTRRSISEKLGVHPQNHLFEGNFEGSGALFQLHFAVKHIVERQIKMDRRRKSQSRIPGNGCYTSLDEDSAFDQPDGVQRDSREITTTLLVEYSALNHQRQVIYQCSLCRRTEKHGIHV